MVIIAYSMNSVSGVKNVINACQECKVKRLIYNSSADVVFDGSRDIYNGDESLPCPWKVCAFLADFLIGSCNQGIKDISGFYFLSMPFLIFCVP